MSNYRLIGGAVCRQDVPGGDWIELTKDEANALLATVPIRPSALKDAAELLLNTYAGGDVRITDLDEDRATRTVKELADILCGVTVYKFIPQPDEAMTFMSGGAVDAWMTPLRGPDVFIHKNQFYTIPSHGDDPSAMSMTPEGGWCCSRCGVKWARGETPPKNCFSSTPKILRGAAVVRPSGITTREWFVGQALAGAMASIYGAGKIDGDKMIRECIAAADAMLAKL